MFSFTMNAADLADVITAGAVASTDSARPLLTGILFEITRDGKGDYAAVKVRATGCDSYALAIVERDGEHVSGIADGETVTALISAKGIAAAVKSVTKDSGKNGQVRVTVDPEQRRATVSALYTGALEYPAEIIEGKYPDVSTVIPADSAYANGGASVLALSPHFIARFCKVAPWNDKTTAMKFEIIDASRPVKATADRTTVLLMPVRVQ